ncbi:MAG TPA: SDR family oxidoreductase [Pyrinomonadaceae bacterium]|nr:SDR family oxidoreductase [Pyrinomonadaceae bacterium]
MDERFAGKSVLITGATSGIGHAVASAFRSNQASVTAIGRNEVALDQLYGTDGNDVLRISADVTDIDAMRRVVEEVLGQFGRLDVLVNAAGHISSGTIETTALSAWDAMMNVNLRAPFQLMQLCTPHLIATKGNVVNISSVTGLRSFPGVLAYCVSKSGLDQLTRCAALELAPKGVRVNAVNPGVVVTEIHKRGGMNEEAYASFLEHSRTTHPLGRVGEPSEIADLVMFLASEKASWITGATYSIDGGRALTCAR